MSKSSEKRQEQHIKDLELTLEKKKLDLLSFQQNLERERSLFAAIQKDNQVRQGQKLMPAASSSLNLMMCESMLGLKLKREKGISSLVKNIKSRLSIIPSFFSRGIVEEKQRLRDDEYRQGCLQQAKVSVPLFGFFFTIFIAMTLGVFNLKNEDIMVYFVMCILIVTDLFMGYALTLSIASGKLARQAEREAEVETQVKRETLLWKDRLKRSLTSRTNGSLKDKVTVKQI